MNRVLLMACALCMVALPAHAAMFFAKNDESSTYGVELRLGPYKPSISNNEQIKNWYDDNFPEGGSIINGHPLMYGAELDWYLFDTLGLLGVYGRVMYWKASGKTRSCGITGDCNFTTATDANTNGEGTQTLSALPVSVGVVYRATFFKDLWNIPLVPYVKGGVDYWFWWHNANGRKTYIGGKDGDRAKGGTWGFHGSTGLALNLDFLEPGTASQAQQSTRITDMFLFFEAQWTFADDFGRNNNKPQFGASPQYTLGLSCEFY